MLKYNFKICIFITFISHLVCGCKESSPLHMLHSRQMPNLKINATYIKIDNFLINKANLRDLIAVTALVILLKLD